MTEQEAIARLREKLTEADEWDESMAIVESADLRALLDREKRQTEQIQIAIGYFRGVHPGPGSVSQFRLDEGMDRLRYALEGKQ